MPTLNPNEYHVVHEAYKSYPEAFDNMWHAANSYIKMKRLAELATDSLLPEKLVNELWRAKVTAKHLQRTMADTEVTGDGDASVATQSAT